MSHRLGLLLWRRAVASRLWVDQRGQAMVEYATITMFGSIVGGSAALALVLPQLMNALDKYLGGIFYVLNLPLP